MLLVVTTRHQALHVVRDCFVMDVGVVVDFTLGEDVQAADFSPDTVHALRFRFIVQLVDRFAGHFIGSFSSSVEMS